MLILQPIPSFLAPVTFNQPTDGGKTQPIQFTVKFKAVPTSQVEDMLRRLRRSAGVMALPAQGTGYETEPVAEPVEPLTDQDIVDAVLCGFGPDVTLPDGSQVEFTPSNVAQLCEIYGVRTAIVRSWFEHYVGAAAKN